MATNAHLGNVISRLSGLKNVTGRRVMDDPAQIGQGRDLEPIEAPMPEQPPLPKFENFAPPQNVPQEDMGGTVTPQSLDVRANSAMQPEPAQQPGFWENVGQALSDYVNPQKRQQVAQQSQEAIQKAQNPPQPVPQQEMPQGMPGEPLQAGIFPPRAPESSPGFFGAISDYFSPTKNAEMEKYVGNLTDYAQMKAQGMSDEQIQQRVQERTAENVAKANQQPWQHAAYGSAFEVANSPALQAQFQQITGQPLTPEMADMVSAHEGAMQAITDELDGIYSDYGQLANDIKERIKANQATDADKYYIGMALMMPLLIGGFFGSEAGFNALAGGAESIGGILNRRENAIRADEEALRGIGKEKADIQMKMADLGGKTAKFAENAQKGREHLGELEEATWVDPKTGKEVRGTELLPGLVANSKFVSTPKGLERMEKAATEIAKVKDSTINMTGLTDDIIDIVSQLKDKNIFTQGVNALKANADATLLDKIADEVNYQGRKVKAGPILQNLMGLLTNEYGHAKDLGQTDRAMLSHIKTVWQNPAHTFTSPQTVIEEMLSVRNLAQKSLVNSAKNHGFVPEFVIRDLEEGSNVLANLNQKDQDKRAEELFREAAQGETRYAKQP